MKKPIIGITSAYEKERELKNYHRTTVCIDYAKSIAEAGGIPLVIPTLEGREDIKSQLELLDGLLLSGGLDINPQYYKEDFLEGMGLVSPERDRNEWTILEEFLPTGKPILGVCRGMQILNIFYGGSLYQDMRHISKDLLKHRQDFLPELEVHRVKLEEDSILGRLFGGEVLTNSFHHQAIDKLGDDLKVTGRTSDDIIEAIEGKREEFLLGVQWHPEMMSARGNKEMLKIFKEFVKSAKLK